MPRRKVGKVGTVGYQYRVASDVSKAKPLRVRNSKAYN